MCDTKPSVEDIDEMIAQKEGQIAGLQRGLPYADHGAYGQDVNKIHGLRHDISELKHKRESMGC